MDSWITALILTDVLERVGVFRAAGAALLVGAAGWLSYKLVGANLSHQAGVVAGFGVPAAMLAWALWHPARTAMSANIVYGVLFCLRLLMFYGMFAAGWTLMQSGFHLEVWIGRAWQTIAITTGVWAVQRVLLVWDERSHRLKSDQALRAAAGRGAGA